MPSLRRSFSAPLSSAPRGADPGFRTPFSLRIAAWTASLTVAPSALWCLVVTDCIWGDIMSCTLQCVASAPSFFLSCQQSLTLQCRTGSWSCVIAVSLGCPS
eukprot:1562515-Pyramimonas_sp.AAC.1